MLRLSLIVSGVVSLVMGILVTAPPAAAQEPTVARTLVSQRVELLPQRPLCWSVFQEQLPPGVRGPAAGYGSGPLRLIHLLEGQLQIEYAGGPTLSYRAGEGIFIGTDNWFARMNIAATPVRAIVFHLTCAPPGAPGPGVTRFGTTETLPGIRSGPVPYNVTLSEVSGVPGSQTAVREATAPVLLYVLEGTVAITTPSGITRYGPGELFLNVPGTIWHNTVVSSTPARWLAAGLTPVGEANTRPSDVRLPSPGPAALPRTGDGFSWAGPLAMLVGALLLAAGIGLRRARVLPIPRP